MMVAFSNEQLEFAALAAKVFAASASSAAPPDEGEMARMRVELAGLGLPLLAIPEEFGGGGLSESDIVLIIEEAGYADVPIPIAETLGVVAPMVARYGSTEQRERWLPALGRGECLGTTVCPSDGLGSRRGGGLALVEHEGRVHVVDVGADGEAAAAMSARTALNDPEASIAELRSRGAWVTATLLNGAARRLLELSVEQACAREQFGVPIGSFQAVKHMVADLAAGIESARATAWGAARALADADPTSTLRASAAKVVASQAGALANDHALQIHGGIGFTREHPLHRWLLYGHELESRWGTATSHQAALGGLAHGSESLVTLFLP
ncbi:acyl-CoA dehydrogenase [Rhodococcus sp. WS4]|nr:acyl-CoA dehydrogenase [Rhodococcus sp. WS4]